MVQEISNIICDVYDVVYGCVFHHAVCVIALCVSSPCVFHRVVCFIALCVSSFHYM